MFCKILYWGCIIILRLIICDDERIIRETIRNLIDWDNLGIQIVGVCRDGIEAYDAIVDEYPDIVLTDIKMPGLSGLELIQKITQTYDKIEFVILSGYGEFSLAAEAMKYGVKHYLLKPCNETQIIEVMQQVKKDCYHNRTIQNLQEEQIQVSNNLQQSIVRNIITETISSQESLASLIKTNSQFLNFDDPNYELCLLTFACIKDLQKVVQCLSKLFVNIPQIAIHKYYIKNSLILFFESYEAVYDKFDAQMKDLCKICTKPVKYQRKSFQSLRCLLENLVESMHGFGVIYSIMGSGASSIYNFNSLLEQTNQVVKALQTFPPDERKQQLKNFRTILSCVNNSNILKLLITDILLCQPVQDCFNSSSWVTELLLSLENLDNCDQIRSLLYEKIGELTEQKNKDLPRYKSFIENTMSYVNTHLGDPNLSLKWIANNYLYMNVDYVSKQFVKQTGQKFSNYLNEMRIERAKKLLSKCDPGKDSSISEIAEKVGCGDHPQYFSQLFKKYTGMTPSAYVKLYGRAS
jgi:two-component system response regulator YesN